MTDRGDYRAIYTVILQSPEFLELSPEGQLVWFHLKLMLGPTGIDVIPAAEAQLQETTGMGSEGVSKGIREGIERGWLRRERSVFWIRNGLKYEPSRTLTNKNHRKSVAKHAESLPKLAIVNDFCEYYGLGAPFPEVSPTQSPTQSPSKGIPDHGNGNGDGERNTEDGRRHASHRADAREEEPGEDWLGEHGAALDGLSRITRLSLVGLYGPDGTDPKVWNGAPEHERPELLATAVRRWRSEEHPRFNAKLFRAILSTVVLDSREEFKATGTDGRPASTPRTTIGIANQGSLD